MDKWEFLVEDFMWKEEGDSVEKFLNEKGNQGWQLAAAIECGTSPSCTKTFYFQRPRIEEKKKP